MRTLEEFNEKLAVSKHQLDDALIEQSQLFWEVAQACALAKHTASFAYAARKEVQGRAYSRIKDQLSQKTGKATEAAVTSEIEFDSEVVKARKEELATQREYELWLAMKESFMQRSYVLKDLAALYVSSYFQPDAASDRPARGHRTPEELRALKRGGESE